jgi:hypothetical protein
MCADVLLCNCCVRELLILARTWFTFCLPSKTGCDILPLLRVGTADLALLLAAVGGVWAPASAPHPHSSSRQPSLPTSARCSWGWPPALPSSAISSCWSNLGRLRTILVPTIFRRGRIRPCPTSPPSVAQGGRTGAPTG